jgi:hypothetical protein
METPDFLKPDKPKSFKNSDKTAELRQKSKEKGVFKPSPVVLSAFRKKEIEVKTNKGVEKVELNEYYMVINNDVLWMNMIDGDAMPFLLKAEISNLLALKSKDLDEQKEKRDNKNQSCKNDYYFTEAINLIKSDLGVNIATQLGIFNSPHQYDNKVVRVYFCHYSCQNQVSDDNLYFPIQMLE